MTDLLPVLTGIASGSYVFLILLATHAVLDWWHARRRHGSWNGELRSQAVPRRQDLAEMESPQAFTSR